MPLPVVLVPGMMCDGRLFGAQISALCPSHAVSVIEFAQDSTIEAMASRALRDAPDAPFLLAGLSLGGIVAMEMLRLAPTRIARLVLMATNHRAATTSFIATRRAQLVRARQGHFREIIVDEFKTRYFSPSHVDHDNHLDLVVDMAMRGGIDLFEAQSRALMTRRDQTDTLMNCRCPTLLVAGADDDLCPVATHQVMASHIAGAELVILPATGHMIPLEQPAVSSMLLRQFAA